MTGDRRIRRGEPFGLSGFSGTPLLGSQCRASLRVVAATRRPALSFTFIHTPASPNLPGLVSPGESFRQQSASPERLTCISHRASCNSLGVARRDSARFPLGSVFSHALARKTSRVLPRLAMDSHDKSGLGTGVPPVHPVHHPSSSSPPSIFFLTAASISS